MKKPADQKAEEIVFGIELETFIPDGCGVSVGHYHGGNNVNGGVRDGTAISAPTFGNLRWKAERDASIRPESGYQACEFVSPKLRGADGILALSRFVEFAKTIGGKVNASCGCHVTVSVPSVIGSDNAADIARFVRKLVRVCNHHAWAIYAQTGTDRHVNGFSRPLPPNAGETTNDLAVAERSGDRTKRMPTTNGCGRGMVNLLKVFPGSGLQDSCVEFRAFAGTLNRFKVMHHVSTCLGLMRKAHIARTVPHFNSRRKPASANDALLRMWKHLGWLEDECCEDVALGIFGIHRENFKQHSAVGMKMAAKFEAKTPKANL